MRAAQKKRAPLETKTSSRHAPSTDFTTLPGYEELRLQRAFAEQFGLENPYFKQHEGCASSHTRINGKDFINFSCYDYLGLNGHPEIVEATKAAIDQYGISCSASRVVAGERAAHRNLERALAEHYHCDDALLFVSGYGTNVGVIGQLLGPKDLMISDSASHNSLLVGGVLSGATRRSFLHNDLDNLEQQLTEGRNRFERALIVVEGLYSMDGDFPNLPRLIEIKQKYHAWLMIDEAHALGVLGNKGSGIAEHFGIDPKQVDIWMGTLSKTLVGCGGYICGASTLIDYLRCLGNAFVYSVGMPPLLAACAHKALEILHREPDRVARLQRNGMHFREYAKQRGFNTGHGVGTAVAPIVIGDSIPTVMLSQRLFERGINVQPVLYPGVPAKTSRLRFFLTAMHTEREIETTIDVMVEELGKIPDVIRNMKLPGYPA